MSVRTGIYDNTSTMRRELHSKGKVVAFLDALMLKEPRPDQSLSHDWWVPWGSYPDIPK